MIILTTSSTAQTLKVIPRDYLTTFILSIRDDSTNIVKHYEISGATTIGNYLTFTNVFSPILVENHFYDITLGVSNSFWNTNIKLWQDDQTLWNVDDTSDGVIYKDKIFCTDQDIDQENNDYYKINKGQYTHYNGYDNTYLVI
tara:strand:+ start:423 stop:851 length:429 start_codon:yes stop_codon:yes gene_type:complete